MELRILLESHTAGKKWKVEKKREELWRVYLEFLHIYLEFQKWEDRKYGGESLFEEIMAEDFSEFLKDMSLQTEKILVY